MPEPGIEPGRPYERGILSPMRLPVSPFGRQRVVAGLGIYRSARLGARSKGSFLAEGLSEKARQISDLQGVLRLIGRFRWRLCIPVIVTTHSSGCEPPIPVIVSRRAGGCETAEILFTGFITQSLHRKLLRES